MKKLIIWANYGKIRKCTIILDKYKNSFNSKLYHIDGKNNYK